MVYPLEVLKTRISIAPKGKYSSFYDCLNRIWVSRGVSGLYVLTILYSYLLILIILSFGLSLYAMVIIFPIDCFITKP